MFPRVRHGVIAVVFATLIGFSSCRTLQEQQSVVLGASAGGSIGALIGKKAGNPAIGATIGAALGGSTGAFISKKLSKSGAANIKPIYVLNGTPYKEKAAKEKLAKVVAENIESVKVLNNEEATAIYGGKGENGAILINFRE